MQAAMRPPSQHRYRRICFTVNNYTDEEYDFLTEEFPSNCRWLIIAKETGDSGTPHLQGAALLNDSIRFSALKKMVGFKRAHLEAMRGTPESNRIYCTKQDPNPFEFGSIEKNQGKRSDLVSAITKIRAGATLKQLATGEETDASSLVKFHRGLSILRSLSKQPRLSPPKVFWFWGPTGTGKTRAAFEIATKFGKHADDFWISTGDLKWFDGYDGQSVAILDDFRAKHASSFAFFLRLLDRYPAMVQIKGATVSWDPTIIIITCAYNPVTCFSTRASHIPEDIEQLDRRISRIYQFTNDTFDDFDRFVGDICEEISRLDL